MPAETEGSLLNQSQHPKDRDKTYKLARYSGSMQVVSTAAIVDESIG